MNEEMLLKIYDAVNGMESKLEEVCTGLARVKKRLGNVEESLTRVEERLDRLEERMDKLETRMDRLEERVGKLETRMDRLEEHMAKLEKDAAALDIRLTRMEIRQNEMSDDIKGLRNKADIMDGKMDSIYNKCVELAESRTETATILETSGARIDKLRGASDPDSYKLTNHLDRYGAAAPEKVLEEPLPYAGGWLELDSQGSTEFLLDAGRLDDLIKKERAEARMQWHRDVKAGKIPPDVSFHHEYSEELKDLEEEFLRRYYPWKLYDYQQKRRNPSHPVGLL